MHIWVEAERVLLVVGSVRALVWLWLWLLLEYQTLFFLLNKQYLHCFEMLLLWLNVDHFEINVQERLGQKMMDGIWIRGDILWVWKKNALNPVDYSSLSEMASFFQQ